MPSKKVSTKPASAAGGGMDTRRAVEPGRAAMKATSRPIDTPTMVLTTASGNLTASSAPMAEEMIVKMHSGSAKRNAISLSRAKRAVDDTVMKKTANMLVATACRDDMPTMIINGTLINELPP